MFTASFSHYRYYGFTCSVRREKKFSIESLGLFCVIFHFIASFSCQLRQRLSKLSLPQVPWHFFAGINSESFPHRVSIPSLPTRHSAPPSLSPGHASVQVKSLVEMVSSPRTMENSKKARDPFVC